MDCQKLTWRNCSKWFTSWISKSPKSKCSSTPRCSRASRKKSSGNISFSLMDARLSEAKKTTRSNCNRVIFLNGQPFPIVRIECPTPPMLPFPSHRHAASESMSPFTGASKRPEPSSWLPSTTAPLTKLILIRRTGTFKMSKINQEGHIKSKQREKRRKVV